MNRTAHVITATMIAAGALLGTQTTAASAGERTVQPARAVVSKPTTVGGLVTLRRHQLPRPPHTLREVLQQRKRPSLPRPPHTLRDVLAPRPVYHTVRAGETLWRISLNYRGTGHQWTTIAKLNGITGTTIYAGQHLRVR